MASFRCDPGAVLAALVVAAAPVQAQRVLHVWSGASGGDEFGYAIAGAADVDGDGLADVVVGSRGVDGRRGAAYVYSGGGGHLLWARAGAQGGDDYGSSVTGVGDVDGDGLSDVAVGTRDSDGGGLSNNGHAFVYSGLDGSEIWSSFGESSGAHFGEWIVPLGDVDADGVPDIGVGAWAHDGPGGNAAGRAYVYSGLGTSIHVWDGEEDGDHFGFAMSTGGDLDGDGLPDVLVGAGTHDGPAGSDSGKAYAYSGATGALLASWVGEQAGSQLGFSVAGGGDLDGDSVPDVLVGAKFFAGPMGQSAGKVYGYSGADGSLLLERDGEGEGHNLGESIYGAEDFDGDGSADAVLGAFQYGPAQGRGRVYVYAGASAEVVWSHAGERQGDWMAREVNGAGDVDGDGKPDFIVSSQGFDGTRGRVYVFAGPLWPALSLTVSSIVPGEMATLVVAGAEPDDRVLFVAGDPSPGDHPCPRKLGGLCTGLNRDTGRPLGTARAGAGGVAELTLRVPDPLPEDVRAIQAFARRGPARFQSLRSQVVEFEVVP